MRSRIGHRGTSSRRFQPWIGAAVAVPALLSACGESAPINPAFPLSVRQADVLVEDMQSARVNTVRPVIVLAGYQDPGFGAAAMARRLRRAFIDPDRIISIPFFADESFDAARDRAIREINAVFPSADPKTTLEVDVVAISMGGLVARHAARAREDGGRRLRIARLFTIATPHQGARLATLPTFDRKQIDMRIDSEFIIALNADPMSSDFEIIPYGRLGDAIVGIERVAPPGEAPWWVPNQPMAFAHLTAASDSRIVADILRRLRYERPLTIGEPSPPPANKSGFRAE
jgi:pimeloyl-ACP methyl ester carboxylesterase